MSAFHLSFVRSILLASSLGLAAYGQEAPLRLAEALARAAERNPALRAQGHAERSAEALIEQAGLRPNPTLDLEVENVLGTGAVREIRGLEATVQASQTFERGGKREKRIAAAGRERDTAAREYAVRRADVLAATAEAFVEALAAQQRVTLAAEPLRLARETVAAADTRVQAGAGSPAESARARAALAAAHGELARAQAEWRAARTRLAGWWGGAAEEVPAIAGQLQVPDTLPNEAEFSARLTAHPRLALQQSVVAAREAALDLERTQAVQDITVGGGVRFLRDGSDAGFVAGVSVPLPVRNRNQGNIRAAREMLAGAEQGIRVVEASLRADFVAAWQEMTSAHAAAQTLRREALPATEEAHAVVRRAYDEGQLPLIDVLDAQRELAALRRELLELEARFTVAHARAEALADTAFSATSDLISAP